jgi:hypothetical protein
MSSLPTNQAATNLVAASAPTNNPTQKLLYDRKSAAHALSISTRSLDYLIANKQLATRRLGKKVMVSHAELVRFSRGDHFKLTQPAKKQAVQ